MTFRVLGPHAPRLASRWAEELFLTPRRRARPERERVLLAGAVRTRARFEGAALPMWIWNPDATETVVLVHGWEGRGAQLGAFVAPLVLAGLRVVTFDAPGHGDAPLRHASVVDHARALLAVVERLGGEVHAVIGHSVGGAAALLATRLGLRTKKLALVAPPTSPARFAAGFARMLGIDARVHAGMLLRLERRYGIAVADLDVRRDSAVFDGELLVVHDEDDRVVPWSDGAAIASSAKSAKVARLVTTRGLGHGRVLEAPSVVSEVASFVSEGARPRTFTETLEGELFCRDTRYLSRS